MESQTKLVSSGADPMVLVSALADCLLSTDCWPRPAHNLAMTKKYQHDPPCNAMQSYTRGKTFFFKSQKPKKMSFSNLDIDILGCPLSLVMLIGLATIVPASLVVAI